MDKDSIIQALRLLNTEPKEEDKKRAKQILQALYDTPEQLNDKVNEKPVTVEDVQKERLQNIKDIFIGAKEGVKAVPRTQIPQLFAFGKLQAGKLLGDEKLQTEALKELQIISQEAFKPQSRIQSIFYSVGNVLPLIGAGGALGLAGRGLLASRVAQAGAVGVSLGHGVEDVIVKAIDSEARKKFNKPADLLTEKELNQIADEIGLTELAGLGLYAGIEFIGNPFKVFGKKSPLKKYLADMVLREGAGEESAQTAISAVFGEKRAPKKEELAESAIMGAVTAPIIGGISYGVAKGVEKIKTSQLVVADKLVDSTPSLKSVQAEKGFEVTEKVAISIPQQLGEIKQIRANSVSVTPEGLKLFNFPDEDISLQAGASYIKNRGKDVSLYIPAIGLTESQIQGVKESLVSTGRSEIQNLYIRTFDADRRAYGAKNLKNVKVEDLDYILANKNVVYSIDDPDITSFIFNDKDIQTAIELDSVAKQYGLYGIAVENNQNLQIDAGEIEAMLEFLSETLNIPKKSFGLGGRLSIQLLKQIPDDKAIGKFSPKRDGGGTIYLTGIVLPHEYGHAIDRYMSHLARLEAGSFITERKRFLEDTQLRDELKQSWNDVERAIFGIQAQEYTLGGITPSPDTIRNNEMMSPFIRMLAGENMDTPDLKTYLESTGYKFTYYFRPTELLARSFETYIVTKHAKKVFGRLPTLDEFLSIQNILELGRLARATKIVKNALVRQKDASLYNEAISQLYQAWDDFFKSVKYRDIQTWWGDTYLEFYKIVDSQLNNISPIHPDFKDVKKLAEFFNSLLPDNVRIDIKEVDKIQPVKMQVPPEFIAGITRINKLRQFAFATIEISRLAENKNAVLGHELGHVLYNTVLTKKERERIKEYFGSEEAFSDAFSNYISGKFTPEKGIRGIFRRLLKFIQQAIARLRKDPAFEIAQKFMRGEYRGVTLEDVVEAEKTKTVVVPEQYLKPEIIETVRQFALAGQYARGWYKEANRYIKAFAKDNPDKFAQLVASFSQQFPPSTAFDLALQSIQAYQAGVTKDAFPQLAESNITERVKAILYDGKDFKSTFNGEAKKIYDFYLNLAQSPELDITIDRWMVRSVGDPYNTKAWRKYNVYKSVFNRMYEVLSQRDPTIANMSKDEFQASVWAGVRDTANRVLGKRANEREILNLINQLFNDPSFRAKVVTPPPEFEQRSTFVEEVGQRFVNVTTEPPDVVKENKQDWEWLEKFSVNIMPEIKQIAELAGLPTVGIRVGIGAYEGAVGRPNIIILTPKRGVTPEALDRFSGLLGIALKQFAVAYHSVVKPKNITPDTTNVAEFVLKPEYYTPDLFEKVFRSTGLEPIATVTGFRLVDWEGKYGPDFYTKVVAPLKKQLEGMYTHVIPQQLDELGNYIEAGEQAKNYLQYLFELPSEKQREFIEIVSRIGEKYLSLKPDDRPDKFGVLRDIPELQQLMEQYGVGGQVFEKYKRAVSDREALFKTFIGKLFPKNLILTDPVGRYVYEKARDYEWGFIELDELKKTKKYINTAEQMDLIPKSYAMMLRDYVDTVAYGRTKFEKLMDEVGFGKIVRHAKNLQYVYDLGFMGSSALVNASQLITNTIPLFGVRAIMKGFRHYKKTRLGRGKYAWVMDEPVIKEVSSVLDVEIKQRDYVKIPLWLFKEVELMNRIVTYITAFEYARKNPEKALALLRGIIDKTTLQRFRAELPPQEEEGTFTFPFLGKDPETRARIEKAENELKRIILYNSKDEFAKRYAREIVELTQFTAELHNAPDWYNNSLVKLIFPYKTFLLNQYSFLFRILRGAVKGNVKPLLRFLAFTTLMAGTGYSVLNQFIFGVLGEAMKEVAGYDPFEEEDLFKGGILRVLFNIDLSSAVNIPLSGQKIVGRFAKAIQEFAIGSERRAKEQLIPRIIKKVRQGYDLYKYGEYRTGAGALVKTINPEDRLETAVLHIFGITPTEVQDIFKKLEKFKELKARENEIRIIRDEMLIALLRGDLNKAYEKRRALKAIDYELLSILRELRPNTQEYKNILYLWLKLNRMTSLSGMKRRIVELATPLEKRGDILKRVLILQDQK